MVIKGVKCIICSNILLKDLEKFILDHVKFYNDTVKELGEKDTIYLPVFYVGVECEECNSENSFIIAEGEKKYHVIQCTYDQSKEWFNEISKMGTTLLKTGQIKTLVDLEKYLDNWFLHLEARYVREGLYISLYQVDIPGEEDNEVV